jgi:hypothetical protein
MATQASGGYLDLFGRYYKEFFSGRNYKFVADRGM